jgi:hypothetical protein
VRPRPAKEEGATTGDEEGRDGAAAAGEKEGDWALATSLAGEEEGGWGAAAREQSGSAVASARRWREGVMASARRRTRGATERAWGAVRQSERLGRVERWRR